MNKDTVKGSANEWMGKAKQQWAKLGDTDFSLLAEGKVQEYSGKIQKAYGLSADEADKQIREFEKSCGCSFNSNRAA